MRRTLEDWLNTATVPEYIRIAKVFALPKSKGPGNPEYGDIRTISVTPAVTKLYELVLLAKM